MLLCPGRCCSPCVFVEVRESGSALGAPVSAYRLYIKDSTNSERIGNNQGCCVSMSVGTALCSCHYPIGYSTPYITLTLYWVVLGDQYTRGCVWVLFYANSLPCYIRDVQTHEFWWPWRVMGHCPGDPEDCLWFRIIDVVTVFYHFTMWQLAKDPAPPPLAKELTQAVEQSGMD